MSEGKSIKEHIVYYMQHGEDYYDRFFCYDFSNKNECKAKLLDAYKDYIVNNNCHLAKCLDETKRIYRNMYSNIRKALIDMKRDKANDFYLNFASDPKFKELLSKYGLGIHGKAIRMTNCKKTAQYIIEMLIPEIEQYMHLKNVRGVKNATINGHTLIDFSQAEIIED